MPGRLLRCTFAHLISAATRLPLRPAPALQPCERLAVPRVSVSGRRISGSPDALFRTFADLLRRMDQ
jgi:hypothetical protein